MPSFQSGDKAHVTLVFGDRKPDGKLDITVEAHGHFPPFTAAPVRLVSFTVDSHLEDLPGLVAGVMAMVAPTLSGGVAAAVAAAGKLQALPFKLPGA